MPFSDIITIYQILVARLSFDIQQIKSLHGIQNFDIPNRKMNLSSSCL